MDVSRCTRAAVAWHNVCCTHRIETNRSALWIGPIVTVTSSSYLVNIQADTQNQYWIGASLLFNNNTMQLLPVYNKTHYRTWVPNQPYVEVVQEKFHTQFIWSTQNLALLWTSLNTCWPTWTPHSTVNCNLQLQLTWRLITVSECLCVSSILISKRVFHI